jgi:hypothetical protein
MAKDRWDPYAKAAAKEMGHQWRRHLMGSVPATQHKPSEIMPIGFDSRSMLGKLMEEWEGAAQSTVNQYFPEFYTGDALLCRRAMTRLEEQERTAIEVHFFIPARIVPVKVKAHLIAWKVSTYYWRLDRGMDKLSRALRSLDKTPLDTDASAGYDPPRNAVVCSGLS